MLAVLQQKGFCTSIYKDTACQRSKKLAIEPQPQCEVTVPSRIIINYLSKYSRESDMFVKIQLSSSNSQQNRLQLDLIETIIQHKKLSNFTFQLDIANVDDENERRLARQNFKTVQPRPFNLFFIDSFESFG